jgi:hypothetical protein
MNCRAGRTHRLPGWQAWQNTDDLPQYQEYPPL